MRRVRLTNRLLSPHARITWSRETPPNWAPGTPVTPHSTHTTRSARAFAALVALLAGGLVALALAGTAAATTPCGKKVLADWFDNGRIDHLYPPHCYEDAIDAIPDELRDYADAEEVISRALQASLRGEYAPGGRDPTPGDGNSGDNDDPKSPNTPNNPNNPNNPGGPKDPTDPIDPGDPPEATPPVDTSGPSTVPIPLLVLGGMSAALLAAGALGYVSRRRQAARVDESADDDTLG